MSIRLYIIYMLVVQYSVIFLIKGNKYMIEQYNNKKLTILSNLTSLKFYNRIISCHSHHGNTLGCGVFFSIFEHRLHKIPFRWAFNSSRAGDFKTVFFFFFLRRIFIENSDFKVWDPL